MSLILCIETATAVCSVALSENGNLLSLQEDSSGKSHSAMLLPFIIEMFKANGLSVSDLDAVAVSKGPGSYTGLRIGVSTAKGLCYGAGKPLIAIDTLESMAVGMKDQVKDLASSGSLFCPIIDARRMEVYSAIYDFNVNQVRETIAEIVDNNSFSEFLAINKVYFAGDALPKCIEILSTYSNAMPVNDFSPSARWMCHFAEQKYKAEDFVDSAYFEPYYLKDFVAGKPKVKGLI